MFDVRERPAYLLTLRLFGFLTDEDWQDEDWQDEKYPMPEYAPWKEAFRKLTERSE